LAKCLLDDVSRGHAIVAFWSADQVSLALLANERFGLRPALDCFEIVADSSVGGEVMHGLGARLNLMMRNIHPVGDARRFEDVGAWMRKPGPFFLAVDGGASYGTVPTGIIRLASRLRSRIWPISVRAQRSVRMPGLIADIPMPNTSIALAVESPMVVDRSVPVAESAIDLKDRLDRATDLAQSTLTAGVASDRSAAKSNLGDSWRRMA
jgi:hypothetical protein